MELGPLVLKRLLVVLVAVQLLLASIAPLVAVLVAV